MPDQSPTQRITAAVRRAWTWVTAEEAANQGDAAVPTSSVPLVEELRRTRFWHSIARAGIVLHQTDRGWTFHHRAVPPPVTWQPVPVATREMALVEAVWMLLRSLHAERTDLDIHPPPRPRETLTTLDALWPALAALGLRLSAQPDDQYRQLRQWLGYPLEERMRTNPGGERWYYTHPFLPRPVSPARQVAGHSRFDVLFPSAPEARSCPPPGFTSWGPFPCRERAFASALTDLLAQFDAMQQRVTNGAPHAASVHGNEGT